MAENNQMIPKPQMNWFQRIRKAFLVRDISIEKYKKAPEYLKNDIEVA